MTTDFHYIAQLDGHLKAAVTLQAMSDSHWLLLLNLMHDGEAAGKLSFNLHGYTQQEAEDLARTIRHNSYVMKEIDEFLWGESD